MTPDPRFTEGMKLFNEGHYFECHEVIEALWLETSGEDVHRNLYKGVIQAAAAIYQWDRGILTGALGLFRTAVGYLENYRPHALGLNTEKLVGEMKIFFKPFHLWDGTGPLPFPLTPAPLLEFGQQGE